MYQIFFIHEKLLTDATTNVKHDLRPRAHYYQLPDEDNRDFISRDLYNRIIKSWITNNITTPI